MIVRVKKLRDDAVTPTYSHEADAGMDLYLPRDYHEIMVWPHRVTELLHGIAIEIPTGYFGLIRPRSGLASNYGIVLATSGVVDAGYRGEIKTCFTTTNDEAIPLHPGERISQMVIIPIPHVELVEAQELSDTSRGIGGHGSTGV